MTTYHMLGYWRLSMMEVLNRIHMNSFQAFNWPDASRTEEYQQQQQQQQQRFVHLIV